MAPPLPRMCLPEWKWPIGYSSNPNPQFLSFSPQFSLPPARHHRSLGRRLFLRSSAKCTWWIKQSGYSLFSV
jgi:hypothetical protein